jgi:hypothetical protein
VLGVNDSLQAELISVGGRANWLLGHDSLGTEVVAIANSSPPHHSGA